MKKILGLTGKKKAGKNYTATIIRDICADKGIVYTEIAYADALKQEVATAVGKTVEEINQHKDQYRLILQWWGTEYRREMFSQSYWIDRMDERLAQVKEGLVVVTDVRFPNEVDHILKHGGKVWRIHESFQGPSSLDKHPSEIALDGVVCSHELLNHRKLPIDEYRKSLEYYLLLCPTTKFY